MSPEDDWCDVEWFDCYLWRPQIGRDVVALTVDGESKNIRFLVCAEQNVCKQDNQASALVE